MEDSILSKLLYYQGNQQIANQQGNQYIPYQITNGIFHRITTEKFTICMETQKTLNNQSNLEKERQSWGNQAPWIWTVLAQKQKYRSMEQDKDQR